jgi:hypothetical protein
MFRKWLLVGLSTAFLTVSAQEQAPQQSDPYSDETLVWTAKLEDATKLTQTTVAAFDAKFAQAQSSVVSDEGLKSNEVLPTETPFQDSDGKSRQPAFIIASQDDKIVLSFVDYVSGTTDLATTTTSFKLKKAVVDAFDKAYKRTTLE